MLTAQEIKNFLETNEAVSLIRIPNIDRILEHAGINETQLSGIERVFETLLPNLEVAAETDEGYAVVIRHLTNILDVDVPLEDILTSLTKISDEENQNNIRDGLIFLAKLVRADNYEIHDSFLSTTGGTTNHHLCIAVKVIAKISIQTLKNDLALNKTEEEIQDIINTRVQIEDAREAPNLSDDGSNQISLTEIPAFIRNMVSEFTRGFSIAISAELERQINSLNATAASLRTAAAATAEDFHSIDNIDDPVEKYIATAIKFGELKIHLMVEFATYTNTLSLYDQSAELPFAMQKGDLLLGNSEFNLFVDLQHHENTLAQLRAISSADFTVRLKQISPNLTDELLSPLIRARDNYIKAFVSLVAARRDVNTLFESSPEIWIKAMRTIFLTRGKAGYEIESTQQANSGLDSNQLPSMIKTQFNLASPVGSEAFFIEFSIIAGVSNDNKTYEVMGCQHGNDFPFDPNCYSPIPTQDFRALFESLLSEEERLTLTPQATESSFSLISLASQALSALPQNPEDRHRSMQEQIEHTMMVYATNLMESSSEQSGNRLPQMPAMDPALMQQSIEQAMAVLSTQDAQSSPQLSAMLRQMGLFSHESASSSSSESSRRSEDAVDSEDSDNDLDSQQDSPRLGGNS